MSRERRGWPIVVRFFILGLLLWSGELAWERFGPRPPRELVVRVPPGTSDAEVRARVDEAILVEEGIALGWAQSDTVLRRRLVQNLLFVEGRTTSDYPSGAEEQRLAQTAVTLGMVRTDLVARRRIVARARRSLDGSTPQEPPDRDTLQAFVDAHPERFSRPARFRLMQAFISHQQHGDGAEARATELLAELREQGVSASEGRARGEPFLADPGDRWVSTTMLDRRWGPGTGARVAALTHGQWAGPVRSGFGYHLVWIHEHEPGGIPSLEVIERRALSEYSHEHRSATRDVQMAQLRESYRVTVERSDAPR